MTTVMGLRRMPNLGHEIQAQSSITATKLQLRGTLHELNQTKPNRSYEHISNAVC